MEFVLKVSHIEVEQELVTLPPVKAAVDSHPFQLLLVPTASRLGAVRRGNQSPLMAESRLVTAIPSGDTTVTTLTIPKVSEMAEQKGKLTSSSSVSVGVAVQVSSSSYIPTKANRPQYKGSSRTYPNDAPAPPAVPPRSVRLSLNYPGSNSDSNSITPTSPFKTRANVGDSHFKNMPVMHSSHGNHMTRTCIFRDRQPPLLEESDSLDKVGELGASNASVNIISDSDMDNSRSGMLSCVISQADTSNESLTLAEEISPLTRMAPIRCSKRSSIEHDEDTLI